MKVVKADIEAVKVGDLIRRVYLDKGDPVGIGVELVSVNGKSEKVRQSVASDSIFFIIEGKGEFEIDEGPVKVEKDYLVFIEKKLSFSYKGKMKMLFITKPPWEKKYEETSDD